jgi:beta-glucosidase
MMLGRSRLFIPLGELSSIPIVICQTVLTEFPVLSSHGLSYTSFSYSNLKIDAKVTSLCGEDDQATISYTITNTGSISGAESSQVYITDVECTLTRPVKELCAFSKVYLAPGQSKEVSVTIKRSAVSFWDDDTHNWRSEPGAFNIAIASSSTKTELEGSFDLVKGGTWIGV